jgi:hypothetical protein
MHREHAVENLRRNEIRSLLGTRPKTFDFVIILVFFVACTFAANLVSQCLVERYPLDHRWGGPLSMGFLTGGLVAPRVDLGI